MCLIKSGREAALLLEVVSLCKNLIINFHRHGKCFSGLWWILNERSWGRGQLPVTPVLYTWTGTPVGAPVMAYLGYSEDFELDDDGILRDSMSCMYNCTLYVSQQFMHKNDNILLIRGWNWLWPFEVFLLPW